MAVQIEKILFSKWEVEVHRRLFRRSVSIYLYPNKPIKVVANQSTSVKVITDFLISKQNWIEKNFARLAEFKQQNPEKKIKVSEKFPFLGKELQFKVVITLNQKTFVSMSEDHLLFHIPRNDWSADTPLQEHPSALKEIRIFYKREAIKILSERLRFWSGQMNLYPAQVKFREQRTRWGSCSSRKVINLNWRLVVFPIEIIDYVLIHELAHLQHMNHSEKFWSLVGKYKSHYPELIKALRKSQSQTEFLSEKDL
jgi:predicted metal-dependent hydrolase